MRLAIVLAALSLVGCSGPTPVATGTPEPSIGAPVVAEVVHAMCALPPLGVVVDPGLRVLDVSPGSAAEAGGVRRGDVLSRVNDVGVNSPTEAKQTYDRAAAERVGPCRDIRAVANGTPLPTATAVPNPNLGRPIPVTVRRGGQELALAVALVDRGPQPGQPTPTPIGPGLDYL